MTTPEFSLDSANSQFTPKTYDYRNRKYHFNVEQGTPFFLKLDQNTCQHLSDKDVKLYRDGQLLQRGYVPPGQPSIRLHGDSFGIQSVDQSFAADYTIKATNGAQISFTLKVKATNAYSQGVDDDYDPSGEPWTR